MAKRSTQSGDPVVNHPLVYCKILQNGWYKLRYKPSIHIWLLSWHIWHELDTSIIADIISVCFSFDMLAKLFFKYVN